MKFTNLRLTGFKSFVEATDFEIRDGLTGIVGPNGCGKSNLLEALRWVMGATSAKALRGEGMGDVIFAGNASGDGGNIDIDFDGRIQTSGSGASGILAQSIGGGGGLVLGASGSTNSVSVDSVHGSSGNIEISGSGMIETLGDFAHGIMVQSVAGGGGAIFDNETGDVLFTDSLGGTGAAGDITITLQDAWLRANGSDASAIWAQVVGAEDAGNITLNIDDTFVRGGSGTGAGIAVDGGNVNAITFGGVLSAQSGLAISGGAGAEIVANSGFLIGNVDLGGGTNSFVNEIDGEFVARVDLKSDRKAGVLLVQNAHVEDGQKQGDVAGPLMDELRRRVRIRQRRFDNGA